jgi:hypothetical protein
MRAYPYQAISSSPITPKHATMPFHTPQPLQPQPQQSPNAHTNPLRTPHATPHHQGISIIQYLFVLAYCLVGIFCFLAVAQALLSGSAGYAILYLVLTPVWMLIITMAFRSV